MASEPGPEPLTASRPGDPDGSPGACPSGPVRVEGDVPCRRCGYSLLGLECDGVCPECGAPVRVSLMGDYLAAADPDHISRLLRGAMMVELSVYLGVLTWCVASPIAIAVMAPVWSSWWTAAGGLVNLGLAWLGLLGWWLVGTRDPGMFAGGKGESARTALRVCVVVSAATSVLGAGVSAIGLFAATPTTAGTVVRASTAAGAMATVALFFASVGYVRVLATRIPSSSLAATARTTMRLPLWILGIGTPAMIGTGVLGVSVPPMWLVTILAATGVMIAGIVWFVWYCAMVSGLRDRLETVRAVMPELVLD
ncbi:MAG: hypothetical protein KDA05_09990 [Phycisphaerales bacterium]|nr:hypothetical protein [Phycisphaerales bacterium]MCB9841467.1 hypothetical protein [Phycisphaeraceae bacterium]